MEQIKDFIMILVTLFAISVGIFLSVFILGLIIVYPINRMQCNERYIDSQYKTFWWCMVKYNNEYIPESLYKEAFTKNINLINN